MKNRLWIILAMAVLFSLAVFAYAEAEVTLQQDEDGWYANMLNSNHHEELIIPEGVTSFKLYDDGGKNGNYSYKSYSYLIVRAPELCQLKISGTFIGEKSYKYVAYEYDYISLLIDGKSIRFEPQKDGQPVDFGPYISSDNSFKISLVDYGKKTYAGLDLTVEVLYPVSPQINIPTFQNGKVTCDKNSARAGSKVTLNVTPAKGYMLKELNVKKKVENNLVDVESSWEEGLWHESLPITFTMPEQDVYISAEFRKAVNGDENVYILPTQNEKYYVNLTDEVSKFRMYSNKGSGNPPKAGSAKIIISAPEGCRIKMSGKFDTLLQIWDDVERELWAPDVERFPLSKKPISEISFLSSGNSILIYYETKETSKFGVDLLFKLYDNIQFTVDKKAFEHVKMYLFYPDLSCWEKYHPEDHWYFDLTTLTRRKQYYTFKPGEEVYIFFEPLNKEEKFVISHVYAVYSGGVIEATPWNHLFPNMYHFTMPNRAVTINVVTEVPDYVMPEIRIDYRVLLNDFTGGTITINDFETFYMGETVILTVAPDEGYTLRENEFRAETVSGKQPVEMTKTGENTWQFTMPEDEVKVFAIFDPDLQTDITIQENYTVMVPSNLPGGTVTASDTYPLNGSQITLTVTANPGYELESLSVVTKDEGETVDVTETDSNTWTFTMPPMPVRVEAVFVDIPFSRLAGNGTEDSPYLIQSSGDWRELSKIIEQGRRTDGLHFYLTNDIEISTMLGTVQTPFSGVFEGMDHTLTILQGNSNQDGFSPFRAVSGATIQSLKIRGTVSGMFFCSGLIGRAEGVNLIQDCVFDGTVDGTNQTAVFVSSSMAGSSITLSGCLDFSGSGCPLGRGAGTVTVTNTYVINPYQLNAASGSWAGKGGILYAVDCDPFLDMRLSDDNAWFQNEETIYAPAGGQIQMTAPVRTGETPYGLIFLSEDQEKFCLMPDENGVFTFVMPAKNLTAHWGCLITFVNEDGTELQRGMYMAGETPEYTGETPVKPDDDRRRCTFMGWTPDPEKVVGDAVYTAIYAASTVLHEGVNTVNNLEEYEETCCFFTPQENGYYRFRSASDGLSLILRIYDDDEMLIGSSFDGTGTDLDNFDCTVELEAGRIYTAQVTSEHNSGNATVSVERTAMYNLTVAPHNTEEGEIYCPAKARPGQLLYLYADAKEGYGLAELTLTGPDGQVVLPADDDAYYMPAFDVTVTVRFAWTNTIGFASDPHVHFETVDVGDEIMAAEDYPDALPGTEVKVCFSCDEGFEFESAIVTADDGSILHSRITIEGMQLYELRFTMPDQFVMVQVLSQRQVFEAPAADFVLPEGLHEIGEAAFEGGNLQTVLIPNGCTVIGEGAFRDCENLTAVVLPANCAIRRDAFDGCPHVTLYSTPGSLAEAWCLVNANCDFAAISP